MNSAPAIVDALLVWHATHRRPFPWRERRDPYYVLVAEFLLQRTPANRVAVFFPEFVARYPSPEKLAAADSTRLQGFSHALGLKKRMGWLVECMKLISKRYKGRVPDTREELMSLPGIGEYTASAVLCFGFGRDVAVVDVNVVRVLSRVLGIREPRRMAGKTVKQAAAAMVPKGCAPSHNEALLDLASLVCRKRPSCNECPLRLQCVYNARKP